MKKPERVKRDDFIVEMHNGGYSHKEIREALEDQGFPCPGPTAFQMIVSRLIDEGRCYKRKLGKSGLSHDKLLKALQLRSRGASRREISEETGIPLTTQRKLYHVNKVRCGSKQTIDPNAVLNSNGALVEAPEAPPVFKPKPKPEAEPKSEPKLKPFKGKPGTFEVIPKQRD